MKSTTKIAKDHLVKSLNILFAKYGFADENEVKPSEMSRIDYLIYIEIDQAIAYLKDILAQER